MSASAPRATALFFPFDLFGSAGTGEGVKLLADALREMLADNRRETAATRARAYTPHVRVKEFAFEDLDSYRDWHKQARASARRVLHDGHFLLWVTGNHLGALPVYEELGSRAGSLVVQFDAHLDIQQFADSTPRPSHGNFLLHAKGPLPEIVNVGHRDLLLAAEAVKATYRATFPAEQLAVDPAPILRQLRQRAARAERVFLDIDCDVFDPAFFPAVSHPLPFGLAPADFLRLLDAAWNDKVAGIAISEFDPGRDRDDRSLAILVWLLEYVLLRHAEGR